MTMNLWTRSAAQKITAAFDSSEASVFGGKFEKALFLIYECDGQDMTLSDRPEEFEFFLNPHTIHIDKEVEFNENPTSQGTVSVQYASTKPVCLNIGEMWFDTYDTRESVRAKYIDRLESLLDYKPGTHYLPVIKFIWGQFADRAKADDAYSFLACKLSVDYTLFLASGTPVRAKVALCLKQVLTQKKQHHMRPKESPDHARIYTVKRGDTLQGIARFAYNDPREWRRIANSNAIDDPMRLRPGTTLLLPPILR